MRIWSIHPRYLDAKGLVALWREALLAKHVLEGKTKGYTRHPQLQRFQACAEPLAAINFYLLVVLEEAAARGYRFDPFKVRKDVFPCKMDVTSGQVNYEIRHLMEKLKQRDHDRFLQYRNTPMLDVHPLFNLVKGEIEHWEKNVIR